MSTAPSNAHSLSFKVTLTHSADWNSASNLFMAIEEKLVLTSDPIPYTTWGSLEWEKAGIYVYYSKL